MRVLVWSAAKSRSLLLSAGCSLFLPLARHYLTKHNDTVAIHESNTREALAVLERVADERLLRLEGALGHLVRLQRVRLLHLLAACLLAHFPLQGRDPARSPTATHKTDGRVSNLNLVWDVQNLDLRVKLTSLPKRRVLLVNHHVAGSRHVALVQALDVKTNVVPRVREIHTSVVHLDSEDLSCARIRDGVRRQEDHLLSGLHDALFHTARQHVTYTLDLIDTRDRHAHRRADGSLRDAAELVKHIKERVDMHRVGALDHVTSLPPIHVLRLLQQVVTHPTGNRHDGRVLLNEILLPSNLDEHRLHLVCNLVEAILLVTCGVAVHLVHANADLLHAQQVDEA